MAIRVFFFILISFQLSGQKEWLTFNSTKPEFNLSFPSVFQTKEKIINTDIGEVLVTTIFSRTEIDSTENLLYSINYFEINNRVFTGDSAISRMDYMNMMYDNIKMGLAADEIYKFSNENNDYPEITYRLENNKKNSVVKGKLIFRDDILYSLQVFTEKRYALNKNIDKFINSFYLR